MVVVIFRSRIREDVAKDPKRLEETGQRMYELASSMPGFISSPTFHTISSCIAWPSPIHTEPITWPSTETGFSARPQSCAAQILWTVTSPVSSSTLTSATWAEYEYEGDGPTPPPL